MKHLTYDEWIKVNPEIKNKTTKCSQCQGAGCFYCDNTGKRNTAHKIYKRQLQRDKAMVKKYRAIRSGVKAD